MAHANPYTPGQVETLEHQQHAGKHRERDEHLRHQGQKE